MLQGQRKAMGEPPRPGAALPNRAWATPDDEQRAREDAFSKQARLLRKELPVLLGQLEKIRDPRDPNKRRHKRTVLVLYVLLRFVFPFASRRETNREMTHPQFLANPRLREGRLCNGCSRRSIPCRTPTPGSGCYATSTWLTSSRPTPIW